MSVKEIPDGSKETNKCAVDKGKRIAHEDYNNHDKENLIHEAGPSNTNLISVETLIDPKAFLGINNVPSSNPEAQASITPLLGFVKVTNSTNNLEL